MSNDTISDVLTQIRNAILRTEKAGKIAPQGALKRARRKCTFISEAQFLDTGTVLYFFD